MAFYAAAARAAHPLISDDAGTQGKGGSQIEVNGQYARDKETEAGSEAKGTAIDLESVLSYGIIDSLDAVLTLPYSSLRETVNGVGASERGVGDISGGVKWRFFEHEGLSFALKPGVSIPTGNDEKGLGAGKYGYSTFLIATQEIEPWVLHLNLGYIRNNNLVDERENLYHASLATEYRIKDIVRIVVNIGQERNPDLTSDREPVFGLAGAVYGLTKSMDLDLGFKAGLSGPETDTTVLAGAALRF